MSEWSLRPCPFCQPEKSLPEYVSCVGVRCRNCLSVGPEASGEPEATKKWNARAEGAAGSPIKRCPWCGEEAGLFEIRNPEQSEGEGEGFFVQCNNNDCGATSPLTYPLADAVIAAWNTRAGEKG